VDPIRWIRDHPVAALTAPFLLLLLVAFLFRSWVDRHPGLATLGATLILLWITGWYAATTRRILDVNQRLALETQRLAKTSARGLYMQSIPIVAIHDFPTVSGKPPIPDGPLVLQNVGQSAAILNRVRVVLRTLGSGGQVLDSKDLGRELLNFGRGHKYALAPSDTLHVEIGSEHHTGGLMAADPLFSACEVEYDDVLGNHFLAKHEPGQSFTLSVRGSGGSWQPIDSFSLDPSTGRFVQPNRLEPNLGT
jgi:hypothetical protein